MSLGSILVIDDEYGVRSGIRQILEMEGYDVAEAETGEEALAQLAGDGFDVALIDYRLPDIDGLTLLHGIRQRELDIMTCMITAYANIDTAIAATRQGIDFFLPKPFSPDDLLGVVETLLRHKRLRAETERLRREHEASLLALAEEKSQTHTLVANLRDAVLVVNRDGEVALANEAMSELLAAPAEELIRRQAAEVLADDLFGPVREHLSAGGRGRAVAQIEIGDATYMSSVVTFRADDGQALGRIVTMSDISEVRRAAMEKARFVRTMVHEVRSPMGAVKSLLEVALDKSLGDEIDPYLPMLERASARIDALVEMVGDLLSLSRIDTERDVQAELLHVTPFIEEAVASEREHIDARGITARVVLPADLPQVELSSDDLRSVLGNLVANAVKYNRDDGLIEVKATHLDGWLRVDVRDTGVGIREDNLARVFDEFFREKRKETREIVGNGLGLSIVKRLAERAGGRLEVTSVEGEGSTFSLLLPV